MAPFGWEVQTEAHVDAEGAHAVGWLRWGVRTLVPVLALMVLGAAVGGWWGVQRGEVHEARASILISPLLGNPFSPEGGGDDLVNLTTESELVTSDAVARLVSDRLPGRPEVSAVLAGTSVTVPPNTQVLRISVQHRRSAEALRRAQLFATTFLAFRTARMQSAVFDRTARVEELVTQRTTEMRAHVAELAKLPEKSARVIPLRQQVLDLTSQISELRTQLAGLQSASRDPGQVVSPAELRAPMFGASPAVVSLVGGAVAGLALGLVLAAVRRRADDRVRVPDDLAELDLPVFGPADPLSAEGCRRVRTALLTAVPQRPMVVLLATPAPSPPQLTEGLAGALGSAGLEVIVVDGLGGTERPSAAIGLSDLIAEEGGVDDALIETAPHVARLGVGRAPAVLDDLVDSPATEAVVQDLRKRADVVLLSVGPARSTCSRSLARLADAALIEVVEDRSTLAEVHDAVDQLRESGGRVVGAVYVRHEQTGSRGRGAATRGAAS